MTMRTLENRTQRIFNNLIKQNQRLGSDSVLKQSTTGSSVRAKRPKCIVQHPGFRVLRPGSSIHCQAFGAQYPEPSVQGPASQVQCPECRSQSPASNTCVQNPGIPVCLFRVNLPSLGKWFSNK